MEVQGLPLTLVSPTGKQATPHLPAKTFANQQGPRDASRQLTTEETELEKHLRKERLILLFFKIQRSHHC